MAIITACLATYRPLFIRIRYGKNGRPSASYGAQYGSSKSKGPASSNYPTRSMSGDQELLADKMNPYVRFEAQESQEQF